MLYMHTCIYSYTDIYIYIQIHIYIYTCTEREGSMGFLFKGHVLGRIQGVSTTAAARAKLAIAA